MPFQTSRWNLPITINTYRYPRDQGVWSYGGSFFEILHHQKDAKKNPAHHGMFTRSLPSINWFISHPSTGSSAVSLWAMRHGVLEHGPFIGSYPVNPHNPVFHQWRYSIHIPYIIEDIGHEMECSPKYSGYWAKYRDNGFLGPHQISRFSDQSI